MGKGVMQTIKEVQRELKDFKNIGQYIDKNLKKMDSGSLKSLWLKIGYELEERGELPDA